MVLSLVSGLLLLSLRSPKGVRALLQLLAAVLLLAGCGQRTDLGNTPLGSDGIATNITLNEGSYWWKVRVEDSQGNYTDSEVWTFTVR